MSEVCNIARGGEHGCIPLAPARWREDPPGEIVLSVNAPQTDRRYRTFYPFASGTRSLRHLPLPVIVGSLRIAHLATVETSGTIGRFDGRSGLRNSSTSGWRRFEKPWCPTFESHPIRFRRIREGWERKFVWLTKKSGDIRSKLSFVLDIVIDMSLFG